MNPRIDEAVAAGRERLAAAGVDLPDLEARLLLAHAAGIDRVGLLARGRDPLPERAGQRYRRLLDGRARRVPHAYLTGEREFWSLRLAVDPRVLVPRPETETLVEAALERLSPGARVADVCTGSGAVVIALATERAGGTWFATDLSKDALEVARANAQAHGVVDRIAFLQGDLLAPLAGEAGSLDAIVANPPYVPTGEIPGLQPEVRDHEPRGALDGGTDGLRFVGRLVDDAPALLRPGGWLLIEVGAGQAAVVLARGAGAGRWDRLETRRDLAGIERVVALRRACRVNVTTPLEQGEAR